MIKNTQLDDCGSRLLKKVDNTRTNQIDRQEDAIKIHVTVYVVNSDGGSSISEGSVLSRFSVCVM